MGEQKSGVSHVFRDLADILETFEITERDIAVTHATPVSENLLKQQPVSVELEVQVPFLDQEIEESELDFAPRDVRLRPDGSLHVQFQVSAKCAGEEEGECNAQATDSDSESKAGQQTESGTSSTDTRFSQESNGDDTRPKPKAKTEMATVDETRANQQGDRSPNEKSGADGNHREPAKGQSELESVAGNNDMDEEDTLPAYRDPEKLQAVYEEYDTFGEMTDALGVDVTPQTVRRYMIKKDIHEPASETGSHSAEVLLNMDPDSVDTGSGGESGDHPEAQNRSQSPEATMSNKKATVSDGGQLPSNVDRDTTTGDGDTN